MVKKIHFILLTCSLLLGLYSISIIELLQMSLLYRLLIEVAGGIIVILILIFPQKREFENGRLKQMYAGVCLLQLFLFSSMLGIILFFFCWNTLNFSWKVLLAQGIIFLLGEALVFWCGMIRIFVTSVQLGMKWRILGALFGFVPIVNLCILIHMIRLVSNEVEFETEKVELDQVRVESKVCQTRYPLLLVHGVFFRDFRYLNYWGRIPKALTKNGATIFYGEQESAASVEDCGRFIAERIRRVLELTGAEKVNIIAHSKGGLDSCFAVSQCGMDRYVASITTVNTPHLGCNFADYLLEKIPAKVREQIASKYDAALKRLGDQSPDFLAAVKDLTATGCKSLSSQLKIPAGVYCQSVASKLNRPQSGKFPLNLTNRFVSMFDGENDGLVSFPSMRWGEKCYEVRVSGKRGVSHGDVIDLNRENIPEFDVREFYIQLVKDLKERGL